MFSRRVNVRFGILVVLSLGIWLLSTGVAQPAPKSARQVTGFLLLMPPRAPSTSAIYVPGVMVRLKSLPANTTVDSRRTDLSGRFRFPSVAPGRYQVCWSKPGIVTQCGKVFSVEKIHLHLQRIAMSAKIEGKVRTLFGKVRLADGTVPRTLEAMFGINAFASVFAKDGNGKLLRRAYVNNYGEYVLPGVPVVRGLKVSAKIEAADISQAVPASNLLSQRINLTFKQHAPKITGLLGKSADGKRWTAQANSSFDVNLKATDAEGHTLRYWWMLPDGTTKLNVSDAQLLGVALAQGDAPNEFTVIVGDGFGGYAKERLKISTQGIRFAGVVSGTDAPVLSGVEVEVNGKRVTTAGDGRFSVFVPEQARYVMNLRRSGYGLVSKIHDNGHSNGRYTMTRATVKVINPTQDNEVVNERIPSDCPGAIGDRYRKPPRPTHGESTTGAANKRECGPGIKVRFPANAFETLNGAAPTGPVRIELTTVDLRAPDGMPGNGTASNQGGDVRAMESYGAGTVEMRDQNGRLRLRTGAQADVSIPIPAEQLAFPASIPASIPLMSYDEERGIWVEEASLQRDGNFFVGKAKHFSAVNADTLKTNQACIRLEAVLMPPNFRFEAEIPQSGAPKIVGEVIANEVQRFHVLINLPTGKDIKMRTFDSNNQPIALIDVNNPGAANGITEIIVNSAGPQNPVTPNEPAFPYNACQVSVELTPKRPVGQGVEAFLNGLTLNAANLTELDLTNANLADQMRAAGEAYYARIDQHSDRESLAEFKLKNGFPNADEKKLTYANSGDLGFGRDMHCRKLTGTGNNNEYACYVTNFGSRFTDDGQDYLDALSNTLPGATVGMEFSRLEDANGTPIANSQPIVKFYVFKGVDGSQRAISADLDGNGERPVPQLCTVCHGGRSPSAPNPDGVLPWNDNASVDMGSRFIPFDLTSLFLLNPNGAVTQQRLRELNCDIVKNAAPNADLDQVLKSMYGASCSGNQIIGNPVDGWVDASASTPNLPNKQEVYAKVVTPSCRTCHVSQTTSNITWSTEVQFNSFGVGGIVCTNHVMPHALVTHNRFWLSTNPHQPLLLHNYLNGNTAPGSGDGVECIQQQGDPP